MEGKMAKTIQDYKDQITDLKEQIADLEEENDGLQEQLDAISEILSPEEDEEEDGAGDGPEKKREDTSMAITKPAFVPLSSYYQFPRYQTREDYLSATGAEAPPFNPNRAPKYWRDPSALAAPRNSIVYGSIIQVSERGIPVPGPDGQPQLDALVIGKAEAAAVNIPPSGTNIAGAEVPEVPMPLRALEAGMELEFGFGGIVRVRDTSVAGLEGAGGFTRADRDLLQRIARALGV